MNIAIRIFFFVGLFFWTGLGVVSAFLFSQSLLMFLMFVSVPHILIVYTVADRLNEKYEDEYIADMMKKERLERNDK